jgi:Ser/Thr protein kinase RdoA (MazF antagonist)
LPYTPKGSSSTPINSFSKREFADKIRGVNPQLPIQACRLYQTSPDQLVPLSGGHYNAVYRFPLVKEAPADTPGDLAKYGILRMWAEEESPEQTLEMLEWVRFLSEQGAPVAAPIQSIHGHLLERVAGDCELITVTAFKEVEGTLAERIPPQEWTDDLFCSIGQAVGRMHLASKGYQPVNPSNYRPQWFESNEIQGAMAYFGRVRDPARDKLAAWIDELRLLPSPAEDYGLIHDDLHFANFLVQPDGKIIIFDFDDCAYGWFAMDVAMALFDVLVLYNASHEHESQKFARRFLQQYLRGYREENSLDPFWLGQMPRFLKLKEMCVYASLVGHADIQQPDSWVGRFMRGRAERIANDVPYVDIDFTGL